MKRIGGMIFALFFLICMMAAAGGQSEKAQTKSDTVQKEQKATAKRYTLRMGLISAETNPVTKGARKFAEAVKARTNGQVDIQVIPGGTLGGEVEMHDMIATGTLDLGCFGNGIPSSYNPEFQLLLMPFLWDSPQQMIAFSKSDIQKAMNDAYTAKSKVKVLAANWDQGLRHTLTKKPVTSVADLKNMKIRVPQLPLWVEMWQLLGANPTPIPLPEVYTALQQGVIDGLENPLNFIVSNSFFEQAKYLTLTGHIMYFNMVFMNEKLFNEMPADVQKVLVEEALAAGDFQTDITRNEETALLDKLKAAGVTVSQIDKKEINRLMVPLYDKWEEKYGKAIRAKVDAFKASFVQ